MNLKLHYKNAIVVGTLLFASVSIHYLQKEPSPPHEVEENNEVFTMIPKNHTLIPIEIKNSESLDSIFGNFGYVNLYIEKRGKQVLIGRNVKLIRAPRNPNQFAALVKDNQTNYITTYDSAFFVSISSEKNSGTVFVNEKVQLNQIQVGIDND